MYFDKRESVITFVSGKFSEIGAATNNGTDYLCDYDCGQVDAANRPLQI